MLSAASIYTAAAAASVGSGDANTSPQTEEAIAVERQFDRLGGAVGIFTACGAARWVPAGRRPRLYR